MEPIAGIFSSPLKESPARGNKIMTSSAMDLQESEYLYGRIVSRARGKLFGEPPY